MRAIFVATYVLTKTVSAYPAKIYYKMKYKDMKKVHDLNYKKLNKMAFGKPVNIEETELKSTMEIANYIQHIIEEKYEEMAGRKNIL